MDDFTRQAAATDRPGLARLLATHVRELAAPEWLAVWVRRPDGAFACADGSRTSASVLELDSDPATSEQLWRGAHFECGLRAALGERLGLPQAPAAIVPVFDRHDHPVGLVAIGATASGALDPALRPRLVSAAAHAGVAFEVIRMAEMLAERLDYSRRIDRELQIAREVQSQLFPDAAPALANATLAAHCAQARSVGGDWYDFLPLGPQQVALVLADVSGKGVHAALRMANLQAHVRSQVGSTPEDPLRALRQVNRLLRERSRPGQFATLFFGVWSDASRRLNYVNCGHNPPLVLRANGDVEWLKATATVLGVFDEWECQLGRVTLAQGDVLFAYSDGVTEAEGEDELFGEDRLVSAVRDARAAGPQGIVDEVIARVQAFENGAPTDDLTMLALSAR
ncbi:MAG: PP2C family protein-serine/threonine phosphatase [Candidatus Eisenbacteria bacterium]|uniref:PP2C family protein-serine/threonine phosphatase n=1 Tax=Eiseniibacteriota bacterium TaxID=2212470 RepID=A0A933W846_UNCEI|nr:PP2C family protein-serine/threonine phosphatase [Candidatus Eisenbacteria bacterium]